jgi:hypothetical protein
MLHCAEPLAPVKVGKNCHSYGHRRYVSAPRGILNSDDFFPYHIFAPHELQETTPMSGHLCLQPLYATQRRVSDLGVPVATSPLYTPMFSLVYSHLASGKILANAHLQAHFQARTKTPLLLELASLSSGPGYLPHLWYHPFGAKSLASKRAR